MKTIDNRTGQEVWTDVFLGMPAAAGRNKDVALCNKKSEKGIALVVVLVLSAVALTLITALIYMITSGTQISGFQKRYKTSLEASRGGTDLVYALINLRGDPIPTNSFKDGLNTAGLIPSIPLSTSTCTGTSLGGTTYLDPLQAKLLTPTDRWSSGCNTSLSIDPSDSTTYDMKLELGTTSKYNYYAKIVKTIEGNTGGDGAGFGEQLHNKGVVSGGAGEIQVVPKSYLYALEVLASNSTNTGERSKLSILYQF